MSEFRGWTSGRLFYLIALINLLVVTLTLAVLTIWAYGNHVRFRQIRDLSDLSMVSLHNNQFPDEVLVSKLLMRREVPHRIIRLGTAPELKQDTITLNTSSGTETVQRLTGFRFKRFYPEFLTEGWSYHLTKGIAGSGANHLLVSGGEKPLAIAIKVGVDSPMLKTSVVFGLVLILVMSLLMILSAATARRYVSIPMTQLLDISRKIGRGQWDIPVDLGFPGEIGFLARQIDSVLKEVRGTIDNLEIVVDERTRLLQETNERLSEQSRFKSQFLANMSHEVRTPLNAIIGYNELLLFRNYNSMPEVADELTGLQKTLNGISLSDSSFGKLVDFLVIQYEESALDPSEILVSSLEFLLDGIGLDSETRAQLQESLDAMKKLVTHEKNKIHGNIANTKDSCMYLLKLINNILDISKIEADRFELIMEDMSVEELFAELRSPIRSYLRRFQKEGLVEVDFDYPGSYLPFKADRVKVRQVLLNLLSNAVKYTPEGKVTLCFERHSDEVHFLVKDTGLGIKEEDAGKLFHEFVRLDNGRQIEGTGLGLALSKKITELHGGKITLESEIGRGSVFTVRLPV
jgi:signal transduction histidine kinase